MDRSDKVVVVVRSAPSSAEFKRGLKLAEELKAAGQKTQLCLLSGATLATAELLSQGWDLASHRDSAQMRAVELSEGVDPIDYAELVDLLMSDEASVIGAF